VVIRLVSGFSQASWIEDKGVSDWGQKRCWRRGGEGRGNDDRVQRGYV